MKKKTEACRNHRCISGFKHYSERLKNKFNLDITEEEYFNSNVFIRMKNEKRGICKKYRFDNMVKVYYIDRVYKYPITVYPIDKWNEKREYYNPKELI